ncbi:MAG TPA: septal ring lytic transglycosylase RlpA family protein, partial [Burkholderiaceae bacterium]|nr:septal ring lytic transglycosylase RlpA family protein [Burkholderiaceae bacterium]
IEPMRSGGPNKPYEVFGRDYVPITDDRAFVERGLASWYGRKFHGRRTASGEVYNMYEMTAAHPTLPIPSYARVRNPANGREVVVRINDRGPFHAGRIVDLSYTAALKLNVLRGVTPVELERITAEQIRTGAWRKPAPDTMTAAANTAVESASLATITLPLAPVALAEAPGGSPAPAPEPPHRAYTPAGRGFWLQFGAFRDRQGAEAFQRHIATELESLAPMMAIFSDGGLHRLQAGPYAHRAEANRAGALVRSSLQLTPIVVERR